MKKLKRILSALLVLCMIITLLPNVTFAAYNTATGRPTDLANKMYLAIYIGGTEFPGEPAGHEISGYFTLEEGFVYNAGSASFADAAEGLLNPQILDDVVEGTGKVWGVFSTTGGSQYLTEASGLVNADGSHNVETEQKIIKMAVDNRKFTLASGKTAEDYTIIWYIIKFQPDDRAWHVDGMIVEKTTFAVNYYGNGNTSGSAPAGSTGLEEGDIYTVLGNPGNLRKTDGSDTYIFTGWNTAPDGTGTHYDEGQKITITENVTLYAEWYLQNKYTITVVTNLDGNIANVESILDKPTTVAVSRDGVNFIDLEKSITGTYVTTVTENGVYYVYYKDAQGNYTPMDNRQVTIQDKNGHTELDYFTVNYNLDGGSWAADQDPGVAKLYAGTAVTATDNVPTREGYTFTGWVDQLGNEIQPGERVTSAIDQKTTLTAQWEENIDLTVNVTLNHKGNAAANKHQVAMELLRDSVQFDSVAFDESTVSYSYDAVNDVTTYSVTYTDLPRAIYSASPFKSGYQLEKNQRQGEAGEDQTIDIVLTYTPDSVDLEFAVKTVFTDETAHLIPRSVNVNVAYWNGQSWVTFPDQTQSVPVKLDADGTGTGVYTVYQNYGANQPYAYRLEVVSFEMPDGRTVNASETEAAVTYVSDGSGLYTAQITVEPDGSGSVPNYGSGTSLPGANVYDDGQDGIPTATITITPYTVTFEAMEGLLEGQQTLVQENQYRYPDLESYVPVANDGESILEGWYLDEARTQRADNLARQYLTGNVTYYAKYSPPMTVQGTVTVEGTYEANGQQVSVNAIDKVKEAVVVLERKLGGSFVEVRSQLVSFGSYGEFGTAQYLFENVPNDGSEYRIRVDVNNYTTTYDNESDADLSWSASEYIAVLGDDNIAVVDAYLAFDPEEYEILLAVDSSLIAEGFRPDSALSQLLYRDLGDIHPYEVLAEHTVAPYGVTIPQDADGWGEYDSIKVWAHHTNGTPYEYQMDVTTLYGNVDGVFTADGVVYNSDEAPFDIQYDEPVRYREGEAAQLLATLVPKEYEIIFQLGLEDGEDVEGMDHFFTDDGLGGEYYSALRTWSYESETMAFPYREGYVFLGWTTEDAGVTVTDHGYITVDPAVKQDVTLVAQWKKLEGTDYTVRHLERYTEKVLSGATVVTGATEGSVIKAADEQVAIENYTYVGAKIGNAFYEAAEDPQLTITTDPTQNVLTLYYVPTDSIFVEQVENNLHLDKTAQLTDNGSYTLTLEAFTTDNPVTATKPKNQPMDVVLVLNQADTLSTGTYLEAMQDAANAVAEELFQSASAYGLAHRMAIVGYADDSSGSWDGTGLFTSAGTFRTYSSSGFSASVYTDALMDVNVNGSLNPALTTAVSKLEAAGDSCTQYGIEIANGIFENNPVEEGRIRVMILFTADHPGESLYSEDIANAAIAEAHITKNTHGAKCYTIGFDPYGNLAEDHPSNVYLKGISSNYPQAQELTDVYNTTSYSRAQNTTLDSAKVFYAGTSSSTTNSTWSPKYLLTYGKYSSSQTGWYLTTSSGDVLLSTSKNPDTGSQGRIRASSNYTRYYIFSGNGSYETADADQYAVSTTNITSLEAQFLTVLQDANTEISTGVVLDENTMLRDIMGQGFVLPQGAVITAYSVAGTYESEENITWSENRTQLAQLTVDGTDKTQNGITVKNLKAANATKPIAGDYLPHTVEYTGFDFGANYLNETKKNGNKLVLEITGVEATDDVVYGRPVFTNSEESALLLAEDAAGNRQQLMTFPTPSTIFIQRAYVLDYGKEFTLAGWYLTADDAGNGAVHLDCDVENGMNRFDASAPNKTNSPDSPYGNTSFGNVTVHDDKTVTYDPVTMSWSGWDPFYVFGRSGRRAVLAQDANQNGNLWHKVTVIPANNVYYEDSFVTSEATNGGNGFDGFTFTGSWETVYEGEGGNKEQGEYQEGIGSGVHGWTDDLADDTKYTDGSAHYTAVPGAAVEFTFTGTGVDVYSRTNSESGMVIATLYQQDGGEWTPKTGIIEDMLAVSGDYYSVPVIGFRKLPYGSYKVLLRAFKSSDEATGAERMAFWVDGIRVYNPTGMTQNYDGSLVQDAYGEETNAVFTSVRDILLQSGSFDAGVGVSGAVFIDQTDEGTGVPTYELGTYETYGPKNEVYLSAGQAIVLKVDPTNNYYIGLKSLTGTAVIANISGTDSTTAEQIPLEHTADLFYKVTPVEGYLVIQNDPASGGVLSVTQLRTTNADAPVEDGGILPVEPEPALLAMRDFGQRVEAPAENTTADQIAMRLKLFAKKLFTSVRVWLVK